MTGIFIREKFPFAAYHHLFALVTVHIQCLVRMACTVRDTTLTRGNGSFDSASRSADFLNLPFFEHHFRYELFQAVHLEGYR